MDITGENLNYLKKENSMIKRIVTDRYRISFNTETGYEELEGINGNPDPFVLDYPSLIDIGVMGNCQNKCEFCYQGDHQQDHMTLENFKRVVDEVHNHTNQMALGGRGNPNKHPNFKELVEYSRFFDMVPNYTTSGLDLTDEEVAITKANCGAVAVSAHNKDYTYRAIDMFTKADVKTNIHFVVSQKSIKTALFLLLGGNPWPNSVDLDKIHAVIFLLFKPQGRGASLTDWILTQDQTKIFSQMLVGYGNFKRFDFMVGADSCFINKIMKSGIRMTPEQEQSVDTCEGSRMSCYISPDMKLMPCSFGGYGKGESILDSSIKQIWDNGKEFHEFREVLKCNPATCPYEL